MATIFEFEVLTEEFALHDTLAQLPAADIEIERVVADNPDQITPYVWARAEDSTRLKLPSTMIRQSRVCTRSPR